MIKKSLQTALLILTMGFSACPDPNALLQSYGYTPLRPPSTLLQPGALITLTSHDPLEAKIICTAEDSLGPNLQPMRSRTAGGMLKKLSNRSFALDASWLDDIKGSSETKAVQNITVTLKNPVIVEISDEDVISGMPYRTQQCAEAVRRRVEGGFVVSMVSSALIGDLIYEVSFNYTDHQRLLPGEKAMALTQLAGMLEGEISDSLSTEIRATSLVLAVRDDEYLSALSIYHVDESAFARGTRHLAPEAIAKLGPDGEVKAVTLPEPLPVDMGLTVELGEP